MQAQPYRSGSEILETRCEARGLIVNLSDGLFDFERGPYSGKRASRSRASRPGFRRNAARREKRQRRGAPDERRVELVIGDVS